MHWRPRPPAPHVLAALQAVQAKLHHSIVPVAGLRAEGGPAQARLADAPPVPRPAAPHVQAAVSAVRSSTPLGIQPPSLPGSAGSRGAAVQARARILPVRSPAVGVAPRDPSFPATPQKVRGRVDAVIQRANPEAVPQLPPIAKRFELTSCYARVGASRIFEKTHIETEEESLKALQMEQGGAHHFLEANRMFEYIMYNKEHLANWVTLVVPGLREAYHAVGIDLGHLPELRIEPVFGTIGFQTMKNMSEYRVGGLCPLDVLHIQGWLFCNTIKLNPVGAFHFQIAPGAAVEVRWSNSKGDFFSIQYQKSMLDTKYYDDKDFEQFRTTGPG